MTKRIRRGDPRRRQFWQGVVRRCQEGGQSVRAFCLAEGLRESAFYFWRRRLARRRPLSGTAGQPRPGMPALALAAPSTKRRSGPRHRRASFLPVRVVAPASGYPASGGAPAQRVAAATETSQGVEIVLAFGRIVRVPSGFARQTLVDVLSVLEGRPC
jgi:transposase-like protein